MPSSSLVAWSDVIQSLAALLVPVVVVYAGWMIAGRQRKSEELLKARVSYYRATIADLNTLMCYMTFIGGWRDISPPEVIALKRRLDQAMNCAGPLFSPAVLTAYEALLKLCFKTFGDWGKDAEIISNAFQRRRCWIRKDKWDPTWDNYFTMDERDDVTSESLANIRRRYDDLVRVMVKDLDINRARAQYTTDLVVFNAHSGPPRAVNGAPQKSADE